MPAATFPEKSVVRIWQHYLPGRTDLVTEDGDGISIVYPGMINGDRGADLVDAVINKDNQILKGSIEVHVKSSSWWSHGHHVNGCTNHRPQFHSVSPLGVQSENILVQNAFREPPYY